MMWEHSRILIIRFDSTVVYGQYVTILTIRRGEYLNVRIYEISIRHFPAVRKIRAVVDDFPVNELVCVSSFFFVDKTVI